MNFPFTIHHAGHSSVIENETGACLEVRRGSLRYFAIPNPLFWNSRNDWLASVPYIPSDLAERPLPPHYNQEQSWMAQWHEESTLLLNQGEDGVWRLEPLGQPIILVSDSNTFQLIPVYMNLECGMMYANGQYFNNWSQTSLEVIQVWRLEMGNYYRIH